MAKDLLKIDFSPPAEAPEEFKVVAFNAEVKKKQSEPLLSVCVIISTQATVLRLRCQSTAESGLPDCQTSLLQLHASIHREILSKCTLVACSRP